jgi:hypothetical protein
MVSFKALSILALPLLAVATPAAVRRDTCSTGSIQCCESVQSASSPGVATLLGLLGIVLQDVTAEVGLTCSPITVIGAGGGTW